MSYVIGIDPGKDGGIALLGDDFLQTYRMPIIRTKVGRTMRDRVDPLGCWQLLSTMNYVDLVIIEGVGGRGKQSAAAAFVFGFSTALVYMACVSHGLVIETVQSHVWKRWMKVPPKLDKASVKLIMKRTLELFPGEEAQFYTPRGRALDGCAEAALMAAWGREHILKEGRALGNAHARLVKSQKVWGPDS